MRRSRLCALAVLGGVVAAFLTHAAAQAPMPSAVPAPATSAAPAEVPGAGHGFLIDKHVAVGLMCAACHTESPPAEQPDTAVCTNCHGNYAQIAAKTASDQPNPHDSHLGDIACTSCHQVHQASQTYCAKCHKNFNMKTP